jgi:hypothetical protein
MVQVGVFPTNCLTAQALTAEIANCVNHSCLSKGATVEKLSADVDGAAPRWAANCEKAAKFAENACAGELLFSGKRVQMPQRADVERVVGNRRRGRRALAEGWVFGYDFGICRTAFQHDHFSLAQ